MAPCLLVTQVEAQAHAGVRGNALANRIEYGPHAWKRMRERGAKREPLVTATTCQAQPEERCKLTRADTAGDALTVIVVIEDGVVVVTLF